MQPSLHITPAAHKQNWDDMISETAITCNGLYKVCIMNSSSLIDRIGSYKSLFILETAVFSCFHGTLAAEIWSAIALSFGSHVQWHMKKTLNVKRMGQQGCTKSPNCPKERLCSLRHELGMEPNAFPSVQVVVMPFCWEQSITRLSTWYSERNMILIGNPIQNELLT